MYLAPGDVGFDVASLRQGDVLQGVPFPLLEHDRIHILGSIPPEQDFGSIPAIEAGTHQHRDDRQWLTGVVPLRFGLCAVLSNCCDLEPRNGRVQTPTVTLARLRPIPSDIRNNSELFESLRANKDPRDPKDPGYIDYFYLEPHHLIEGNDWRVHFNQVVSLPTSNMVLLLRKKVLQLSDRTRMKFKIKLGFTLMRPNDDEIRAGLENPWDESQQSS